MTSGSREKLKTNGRELEVRERGHRQSYLGAPVAPDPALMSQDIRISEVFAAAVVFPRTFTEGVDLSWNLT